MKEEGKKLLQEIETEIKNNKGKISADFIDNIAIKAKKTFIYEKGVTFCILETKSGHKVTGEAMILVDKNNDPKIGEKIAFNKAKEKLWGTIGALAKLYA